MTLLEQIDRCAELKRIIKRSAPDGWTQQEAKRELKQIEANLAETERLAKTGRAVEAMPNGYRLEHDVEMTAPWIYMDESGAKLIRFGDTPAEALGVEVTHDSE